MEPSLHRKTFMKPVHADPEFCSTCHKVALIPAFNCYKLDARPEPLRQLVRLGVSGRAVRSFYDPPATKACRDCHLPPHRSDEFGNQKGFHRHAFPAANTALPFIRGDKATEERIRKFLQDKVLTVDLFAIRRGDDVLILGVTRSPSVPARRSTRSRRADPWDGTSLHERNRGLQRDTSDRFVRTFF